VKRLSPLAIAALALSACAKPVPPPVVDMASIPCADAMAMTGATALQFDPKGKDEKTTDVILDGKSSCLREVAGNRRLYQVFALPPMEAPYIIAVRTSPWADTILAPRVLLLDGDGKITRETTHADFIFRGEQLSALLRSHPGETYLALTSDSEVLGKEITRVVEAISVAAAPVGAGGTFLWYSGTDTTHRMVLSVAGRAEITISPYQDQKK
jgi:hypothetical protein